MKWVKTNATSSDELVFFSDLAYQFAAGAKNVKKKCLISFIECLYKRFK
jgi:hypothetical protein